MNDGCCSKNRLSRIVSHLSVLDADLWLAGKVDEDAGVSQGAGNHATLDADKKTQEEGQAIRNQIQLCNEFSIN